MFTYIVAHLRWNNVNGMFTFVIVLLSVVGTLGLSSLAVTVWPKRKRKRKIRVADPITKTLKQLKSEYDEEVVEEIRRDIFQNRK